MENYAVIQNGHIVCRIANKPVLNKKTTYCHKCESCFVSCRFSLDEKYK